ncbi:pseudaminic acid cytidylyltransferase [Salidesulfovibrio brasiliensis]|uniref:pseudaminic acid cytidylyltransferase n=1 Tax=Salidesulfovibrio brasiliensis TaxID=221711 RepID=UPI0006CFB050|nr:pseudaminic acid cytidylyltransferase [Salidesulfovibrio brasiliensis]
MATIAIIPARGGSKRIPRKNVKPFCGKPMIAWPIETLLDSKLFDHVYVSTDSEEIASVAREWGAEIPFMRPDELADDYATTEDVVLHALDTLQSSGLIVDKLCCVYPTSIFLTPELLEEGFELINSQNYQMVMSITEFPFPIQRALTQNKDGRLSYAQPEHMYTRSQDLPDRFQDAAQFYLCDGPTLTKTRKMFGEQVGGVTISRKNVVDIDTPEDWDVAQMRFESLRLKQGMK